MTISQSTSSQRTRVSLFGGLVVELGGRRVDSELPGRQGPMLFAYLVANRGREVARDELIAALWPDTPPANEDAALSVLLSRVRSAVGPDLIEGRSALRLALPPDTTVDLELAIAAVAAASAARRNGDARAAAEHARRALEITSRPLLAGLRAPWIDERRREVEEMRARALEAIAEAGVRLGGSELAEAEQAARELIRLSPYRESGYTRLMEAHAAQGNLGEALQVYDLLRSLLRDELGSAPGPAIRELHERLLRDAGEGAGVAEPQADAPSAPPPLPAALAREQRSGFVGREAELALLREAFSAAAAGPRQIVLMGGEPGIGKTRLARELALRAHEEGASVLHGRCYEETLISYEPFVTALREHVAGTPPQLLRARLGRGGGELARLLPELRELVTDLPEPVSGDPSGERYRTFEAVAELLTRSSADKPLVLILEDVHWADRTTLMLLLHLARFPRQSRLLVIATYRETEVTNGHPLASAIVELHREDLMRRVSLRGLDERELAELVRAVGGRAAPAEVARAIREETEGNPLFAGELVRHLLESGAGLEEGGAWRADLDLRSAGIPESVKEVIGQRVSRLGGQLERVLAAAAVLGRSFHVATLERVAAVERLELAECLESAVAAGLVQEVPGAVGSYAFFHPLVRETLYESLSATRRAALHRRAGEALESSPAGARRERLPELAHHFLEAVRLEGAAHELVDKAMHYARLAGERELGLLAFAEAAGFFERGLEAHALAGADDRVESCDLLLALGNARWRMGDRAAARDSLFRAAEMARALGEPERLARAAMAVGSRYPEVGVVDVELADLLEDALARLPRADSALRAMTLARLGQVLYFSERREEGLGLMDEALAMAERVGEPEAHAAVLACQTRWGPDELERRGAVAAELLRVAIEIGDRELILQAHQWRSTYLLELGDRAAAQAEHDALELLSAELRQPYYHRFPERWKVLTALIDGRFGEVEALAEHAYATAQRAQMEDAAQIYALHVFCLRLEQGRAAELLEPMEQFAAKYPAVPAWRCGMSLVAADAGDHGLARREFERFARDDFRGLPRDVFWTSAVVFLAETCAQLADGRRAEVLYALLQPYEDRVYILGDAVCGGPVCRQLGQLAATAGRADDAIRHFELGLGIAARLDSRPLAAWVELDLADVLRERDPARARELLEGVRRDAEALGMARLAARAALVEV